jgi:hypothetical protein
LKLGADYDVDMEANTREGWVGFFCFRDKGIEKARLKFRTT